MLSVIKDFIPACVKISRSYHWYEPSNNVTVRAGLVRRVHCFKWFSLSYNDHEQLFQFFSSVFKGFRAAWKVLVYYTPFSTKCTPKFEFGLHFTFFISILLFYIIQSEFVFNQSVVDFMMSKSEFHQHENEYLKSKNKFYLYEIEYHSSEIALHKIEIKFKSYDIQFHNTEFDLYLSKNWNSQQSKWNS